jgi:hypothetical protein
MQSDYLLFCGKYVDDIIEDAGPSIGRLPMSSHDKDNLSVEQIILYSFESRKK